MCNCIETFSKNLHQEDPEGYLRYAFYTVEDKNLRMYGSAIVRAKNKKGKFTNKTKETLFKFSFCPFCGEKYE